MITTTHQGISIKKQTLKLLTDKKVELYNITQKVKEFVKEQLDSGRDSDGFLAAHHHRTVRQ